MSTVYYCSAHTGTSAWWSVTLSQESHALCSRHVCSPCPAFMHDESSLHAQQILTIWTLWFLDQSSVKGTCDTIIIWNNIKSEFWKLWTDYLCSFWHHLHNYAGKRYIVDHNVIHWISVIAQIVYFRGNCCPVHWVEHVSMKRKGLVIAEAANQKPPCTVCDQALICHC